MKTLIALLFVGGLAAQTPPMIPMATGGGPVGGATNLTTVGSVPYVSASGTLDQDAGQFFWDATNNRLGIGTATPDRSLEVKSTIYGGVAVTTATVSDIISFTLKSTAAGGQDWRLEQGRIGAGILNFYNGSTGGTPLTILANGNVGIGTTGPGSLLHIKGAVATGLKVESTGGYSIIDFLNTGGESLIVPSADTMTFYTGAIGTTTAKLDIGGPSTGYTLRVYDQTATTGSTGVTILRGAAQTGASTVFSVNGVVAFAGDNNGGAGAALLGANSPATTLAAPYTWIKIRTADNSIAYIPVWK